MVSSKKYIVGGMEILVNFHASLFCFPSHNGSTLFEVSTLLSDNHWIFDFHPSDGLDESLLIPVFCGNDSFQDEIPYRWSIVTKDNEKGIFFEFQNHPTLISGLAIYEMSSKTISVNLVPKLNETFELDPFFHPLGILSLVEMVRSHQALIIHASAVNDGGNGYLFSAVSGTGKSTMAALWRQMGATIINDDRVIISVRDNGVELNNTPMPYYEDYSKTVALSKLFLIKQSLHNYIKPLSTIQATLGLMGNCIQHHYNKNHVEFQLGLLEQITKSYEVFELGFKPDTDIVNFVRTQFDERKI